MFHNDSETVFGKSYPDWVVNGGNHGAMQIGEENKGDVFMVPAKIQNDNLGENRRHMICLFNLKMICKLCRVYISGSAKSSGLHTILVIDCVISRLKRF
jgi:hypothetical protein